MAQKVVLHVEDDSDDAFFVARAFRKALPQLLIRRVKDGREAIDYLGGTGEWAAPSNAAPDFVLLDLKLPDIDGFEVLQWIRKQPRLKEPAGFHIEWFIRGRGQRTCSGVGSQGVFRKNDRL
jgi:CheY-like chemotaxis protein